MPKGNNKGNKKCKDTNDSNSIDSTKGLTKQIVITVVSSLICSILVGIGSGALILARLQANFENMQNNASEMKEEMSLMSKDINDINGRMIKAETNIDAVTKFEKRICTIENAIILSAAKTLEPAPEAMSSIGVEFGFSKLQYNFSKPKWNSLDIIAKDVETGREYEAQELVGQKILLPYKNGKQDVLFYGQFNEDNLWDKNCIINIYENNQLVLIMDAIYDAGNLLTYKQAMPYNTVAGEDIWIVSNRTNSGGFNTGESWNYIRNYEIDKNFDFDCASEENIVNVELFKLRLDSRIEGYYCGNTSGGFYNDNTGGAYLVKYADDGTVRTLYQGNFKNGQFDDSTGQAWYITRDTDTKYMYYKGVFRNGGTVKTKDEVFINPVSLDVIEKIIQEKNFNCILKWSIFDV